DEIADLPYGHRYVVFEARSLVLLRFRYRVAKPPEVICLRRALCHDGVPDDGLSHRREQQFPERFGVGRIRRLHQHIPGITRPERISRSGDMIDDELQRPMLDEFKGLQTVA